MWHNFALKKLFYFLFVRLNMQNERERESVWHIVYKQWKELMSIHGMCNHVIAASLIRNPTQKKASFSIMNHRQQ